MDSNTHSIFAKLYIVFSLIIHSLWYFFNLIVNTFGLDNDISIMSNYCRFQLLALFTLFFMFLRKVFITLIFL